MSKDLDFIKELSQDLKSVKPLLSPERRTILWLFLSFLIITGLMFIIKPLNSIILNKFTHPTFVVEFSLIFGSIVSMSYASFLSVVPGAIAKKNLKYFFAPVITLFTYYLIKYIAHMTSAHEVAHRPTCLTEVLVYAVIPSLHILWLVKKGFFVDRRPTLFYATTSAALVPALLMHLGCMHGTVHVMMFHLAPAFIISIIGYFISMKVIKDS